VVDIEDKESIVRDMHLQTTVTIKKADFEIKPTDKFLFVGSCFADKIGGIFKDNHFRATVNPYGVMYNPASVLHTITKEKAAGACYDVAIITLGTNHVYILNETGEIVDNCQKRPAALFLEEVLTVDACADYLQQAVDVLRSRRPDVQVVLTVSPIRYRKYGYHESQLSKATLLLASEKVAVQNKLHYFPAYEIINDELRDYRFYASDMLHPSEQAVEYIWERLVASCFSDEAKKYLEEWRPLKQVLQHKPFNPDSYEYRVLMDKTMLKIAELRKKYSTFAL
jgi:lysophospholipase L1-like esterase